MDGRRGRRRCQGVADGFGSRFAWREQPRAAAVTARPSLKGEAPKKIQAMAPSENTAADSTVAGHSHRRLRRLLCLQPYRPGDEPPRHLCPGADSPGQRQRRTRPPGRHPSQDTQRVTGNAATEGVLGASTPQSRRGRVPGPQRGARSAPGRRRVDPPAGLDARHRSAALPDHADRLSVSRSYGCSRAPVRLPIGERQAIGQHFRLTDSMGEQLSFFLPNTHASLLHQAGAGVCRQSAAWRRSTARSPASRTRSPG